MISLPISELLFSWTRVGEKATKRKKEKGGAGISFRVAKSE